MKKEYFNIIIYFYISLRHLINAHFHESKAYFIGALWRSWEWISYPFLKLKVDCTFCGWKGPKFKTFVASTVLRHNALCPQCLSLERHREFLHLFHTVSRHSNQVPLTILDIAPTLAFSHYCQQDKDIDYLSVDLQSQFAMKHMNLENLTLPSNSYNVVVCYHVLDYLNNDTKGMSEIHRVLKDDGIAITQEGVDYKNPKTIEWKEALPENEYRIRQYGVDFFEKWGSVGFQYLLIDREGGYSPVLVSVKNSGQEILKALVGKLKSNGYRVLNDQD